MQWDQKLEIFFTYKARKHIHTHNWALELPGDVSQPTKHWPSHYITVLTSCSQVLLLNKNKNLSSVCIKWNSRHSSCWDALANNNQHNTKHYSNLKKTKLMDSKATAGVSRLLLRNSKHETMKGTMGETPGRENSEELVNNTDLFHRARSQK